MRSGGRPSASERGHPDVPEVPRAPLERPKRQAIVRSGTSLVLSLLLHLPLLPIALVIGLYFRLERAEQAVKTDYVVNETTIAVDLWEKPALAAASEAIAPTPPLPAPVDESSGTELGPHRDDVQREEVLEARASEASFEAIEEEGSLGTLEDETNVSLSVWTTEMRRHELAPLLSSMLACGKLGKTLRRVAIDPFDDIESAVFAGPRLNDATQYTAAFSHRIPDQRLQRALARLTWPHGRWLDESSVRVRAAGAMRVVFRRGEHLVLATPERVWEKMKSSPRAVHLPPSRGRVFSLALRQPAMALARLGLDVPQALSRMRLDAFPLAEGQVELRLRFEAPDAADVQAYRSAIAREIDLATQQLRQAGKLASLLRPLGVAPLEGRLNPPRFRFDLEGKSIVGVATLDREDVQALLRMLVPVVCEAEAVTTSRGRP